MCAGGAIAKLFGKNDATNKVTSDINKIAGFRRKARSRIRQLRDLGKSMPQWHLARTLKVTN